MDRRQAAIDNNVGLYRSVLGARGIGWQVEDGAAWTAERVLPYYSNLVTRAASWRPDGAFRAIERRAREEGWADWSIKDSFGTLDLGPEGFEKLFEAEWMMLDPAAFEKGSGEGLRFDVIQSPDDLPAWWARWDPDPRIGPVVFGAGILDDPDVHLVAGYAYGELVAGGFINRTGPVLGFSNWFSPGGPGVLAEALDFVRRRIGAAPVVCYDRGQAAEDLRAVGFVPVGPLAVWRLAPG